MGKIVGWDWLRGGVETNMNDGLPFIVARRRKIIRIYDYRDYKKSEKRKRQRGP